MLVFSKQLPVGLRVGGVKAELTLASNHATVQGNPNVSGCVSMVSRVRWK